MAAPVPASSLRSAGTHICTWLRAFGGLIFPERGQQALRRPRGRLNSGTASAT
jgi:hypothetical protein